MNIDYSINKRIGTEVQKRAGFPQAKQLESFHSNAWKENFEFRDTRRVVESISFGGQPSVKQGLRGISPDPELWSSKNEENNGPHRSGIRPARNRG